MKNKEEFLAKLSKVIDQIEDSEAEIDYLSIQFTNYNPDNRRNERKLSFYQADIRYDYQKKEFSIIDISEPFKCTMGASDCEERGYCNGDC